METTTAKQPKFVRWALLLGIIVILNIFFVVLISLAVPPPDYATYCPAAAENIPSPTDAADCAAVGGAWTETGTAQPATTVNTPAVPDGYCDLTANCQGSYLTASNRQELYAFVFMIGLGILSLLIGLMPIGSSIVSSGLSYGGVLALVIGSAEYWNTAGNWIRLAIAFVGLLALLYVGWKRFRD